MIISGTSFYARIVGEPHTTKYSDGQWSFDLSVDEETVQSLTKKGVNSNYFRDKGDERGTFISFQRNAHKADGSAGKPYEVVDSEKNPWDPTKAIGNGSKLNVIVMLSERKYKGVKTLKPEALKIQVWEHVPFTKRELPTRPVAESEMPEAKEDW